MAQTQAITVDYDPTADVQYVTLGDPREATCIEPEEGILLRVDPDTNELAGLTILHFQRRLKESGERLASRIPLIPPDLMPAVLRQYRLQHAPA